MVKIVLFFVLLHIGINAKVIDSEGRQQLHDSCLACHTKQQIPSSLIYRRYLMKYSTFTSMEKAIFGYMKNPRQQHSIMPPQFFLKFPMKEHSTLDDTTLKKMIRAYLHTFDVKRKLTLMP